MIFALVLVLGSIGLAVSQTLVLSSGDITPFNGTVAILAWTAIAMGIWGAKDLPQMARPGRVGVVMICFAALSFGMVMIITLTSGTLGALQGGDIVYGDIVYTPFYVLALIFLVAGLAGFALHFLATGTHWLAAGCGILAIVHAGRLFIAEIIGFHASADLALALALLAVSAVVLAPKTAKVR